MQFTQEETNDIKSLLRFLIEKKAETSGGHCGFHLTELNPFLEELEKDGEIKGRDTLHSKKYFLNKPKL